MPRVLNRSAAWLALFAIISLAAPLRAAELQKQFQGESDFRKGVWQQGHGGECIPCEHKPCEESPCHVTYLNAEEREEYKLQVGAHRLATKGGQVVDTDVMEQRRPEGHRMSNATAWFILLHGHYPAIWVMDDAGNLYVSVSAMPGVFNHSSFFAGKPVKCAGEIAIVAGKVVAINNRSGHYKPTRAELDAAVAVLSRQQVINPDAKHYSEDEDAAFQKVCHKKGGGDYNLEPGEFAELLAGRPRHDADARLRRAFDCVPAP